MQPASSIQDIPPPSSQPVDAEQSMKVKYSEQFHFDELFEETQSIIKLTPNYCNFLFPLLIAQNILEFLFLVGYKIFLVLYKFAGPYLTAVFIGRLEELEKLENGIGVDQNQNPFRKGNLNKEVYFTGVLIFIIVYTQVMFIEDFNFKKSRMATKMRSLLYIGIYEKIMRSEIGITNLEREPNILNIFHYDIPNIDRGVENMIEAVGLVVDIVIATIYLYSKIKELAFNSLYTILILLALNIAFVSWSQMFANRLSVQKDRRVSLIQEVFNGIKQIKLLNFEKIFFEKILKIRRNEYRYIKLVRYIDAFLNFILRSSSLILLTTLFSTVRNFKDINIYSALIITNLLVSSIFSIPWTFGSAFGTYFSYLRISQLLSHHETPSLSTPPNKANETIFVKDLKFNFFDSENENESDEEEIDSRTKKEKSKKAKVQNEAGKTSGSNNQKKFSLSIPNFSVSKGNLVLIVGKNGLGKTTFLRILMNELAMKGNTYEMKVEKEQIAYVAQNSWLVKGTIKENIIFGNEFDEQKYDQCLDVCELKEDLKGKDVNFDVGMNGGKLSGGQRQRVALCRAVYQDKEIYLLDDIFSSIDENVANKIFNKCIINYLRKKGKTIILTSAVEKFTSYTNLIYEIKNSSLVLSNIKKDKIKENLEIVRNAPSKMVSDQINADLLSSESNELKEEYELDHETVFTYISFVGGPLFFAIVIFSLIQQAIKHYNEFWFNNYITSFTVSPSPLSLVTEMKTLAIIFGIFTLVRGFLYAYGILKASRNCFFEFTTKILNSCPSFFDKYSIGDIMTNFTKDVEVMDCDLPEELNGFFSISISIIGLLGVIVFEIPIMLFAVIYISVKVVGNYKFYSSVNRKLKISIKSKDADLNSHITETLNGLSTIRAFSKQTFFKEKFVNILKESLLYPSIKDFLHRITVMRLSMISGVSTSIIIAVVIIFIAVFALSLKSSVVGMALSYSFLLSKLLVDIVCCSSNLESKFYHVKNINNAIETSNQFIIDSPKVEEIKKKQANKLTLSNIVISFQNVYMSYDTANKTFALKNITLEIPKKFKVAFCGTTGSGKSSIFNLLLKLYPFQKGKIYLNGMNIHELEVSKLREQISIIPQNGFLFRGSLKENIDPENKLSRSELEKMLSKYECNEIFQLKKNEDLLKMKLESNGSNLSNGQKQIVNFLQNMLMEKEFVLIDEATSNLDEKTNNLMMQKLFEFCKNKTLIMISHRLEYLKNFDLIFVMSKGEIVEKGCYKTLSANPDSHFSKLKQSSLQNK